MLPEIFRLLWWTLIHRPKRATKAKKAAPKRAARKTARKTAHKKAPAPRSGRVHHPRKAASPKPATTAA